MAKTGSVREQASSKAPPEGALVAVDAALALALAVLLPRMLHVTNSDLTTYYLPWYQHILQHGRWASLEGSYANYNPPYLYLLSAASFFNGTVRPLFLVKLMEVPAILAAGALGWSIARAVGAGTKRAVLVGVLLVLSPEVVSNALMWGQVDILYSVFLVLMLRLLLARRPNWAMVAFGVAVAIKLQAATAGVALAALLLAGELPWLSLPWALVGYVGMLCPAWLAGRPARELLFIYRTQFNTYPEAALNVPNPYQLLNHFTNGSAARVHLVTAAGLAFAAACTLAIIYWLRRAPRLLHGRGLIMAVALPLMIEPFVLPKMHERYFFPGNLLLVLMAGLDRRFILPAVLAEGAVLAAYVRYLGGGGFVPSYYVVPVCMMSAALVLFLRALVGQAAAPAAVPERAEAA